MRHRRSTKFLAVFAGVALFAAACAGDDDAATPDETEAPAPDDDPADEPDDDPADPEPVGFECNREGGTVVGFASPSATPAATPVTPAATPSASARATVAPGADGGTLVWAHEQEPPDLHLDDPSNNLTITSWIQQSMIDGLYGVSEATTFIPELLDGEANLVTNDDGSVTAEFTLRDGLTWSDGTPLTTADVQFTYDVIMATDDDDEFVYLIGSRVPYLGITDLEIVSDTQINITWGEFFSGFPAAFDRVWPSQPSPTTR